MTYPYESEGNEVCATFICRGPPHGQLKNCICGSSGKEIWYGKMLCSCLRNPDTSASHATTLAVSLPAACDDLAGLLAWWPGLLGRRLQHVSYDELARTRLLSSFCANASALARDNVKFLPKTWIPLATSEKSRKNVKRNQHFCKKWSPLSQLRNFRGKLSDPAIIENCSEK